MGQNVSSVDVQGKNWLMQSHMTRNVASFSHNCKTIAMSIKCYFHQKLPKSLCLCIACPIIETAISAEQVYKIPYSKLHFELQLQTKLIQLNGGSFFFWNLVFQVACVFSDDIGTRKAALVLFQEWLLSVLAAADSNGNLCLCSKLALS